MSRADYRAYGAIARRPDYHAPRFEVLCPNYHARRDIACFPGFRGIYYKSLFREKEAGRHAEVRPRKDQISHKDALFLPSTLVL